MNALCCLPQSLPPSCLTGPMLEKARGGTHRILEGWPGLKQARGEGLWHLLLPTPRQCTCVQPRKQMCAAFANIQACTCLHTHWPTVSFDSLATARSLNT